MGSCTVHVALIVHIPKCGQLLPNPCLATPVSVHMVLQSLRHNLSTHIVKVFKMVFRVWLFGVFVLVTLLWLRRRREACCCSLLSRERARKSRFLHFIAAQGEQRAFFTFSCAVALLLHASRQNTFGSSLGTVNSRMTLLDIGVTKSGSKTFT